MERFSLPGGGDIHRWIEQAMHSNRAFGAHALVSPRTSQNILFQRSLMCTPTPPSHHTHTEKEEEDRREELAASAAASSSSSADAVLSSIRKRQLVIQANEAKIALLRGKLGRHAPAPTVAPKEIKASTLMDKKARTNETKRLRYQYLGDMQKWTESEITRLKSLLRRIHARRKLKKSLQESSSNTVKIGI